jgi:hypothetical protein
MSNDVLKFELADGTPVYVETSESVSDSGLRRAGRGAGQPTEVDKRFEDAVARIRPAAQVLLDSLRDLNTPEEISLEFGIKFSASAGAIFASVDSEAAFKVSITWKNTS